MNRTIVIAAATALSVMAVFAQDAAKPATPSRGGRLGGYASARVDDPQVKAAAEFAVREQAKTSGQPLKLVRIRSAEQQVVAGMNYRLSLDVRDSRNRRVRAVVYRDLKNNLSLSSWRFER